MFTVIFCSDELNKNCTQTYGEFLAPFFENADFAFCHWNTSASTLDEAVPELRKLIRDRDEWRALIVLDGELYGMDAIRKCNPYNYVDATSELTELTNAEQIYAFRQQRRAQLLRATENPLVKLGMWLTGSPSSEFPPVPELYDSLPDVEDAEYFEQLHSLHLSAAEVELDRLTAYRGELLAEKFVLEGQLHKKPSQVVVLCERMYVNDNARCKRAWQVDQEHAYSRFFEDNLYSSRMRCLVSDIRYTNGQRVESAYFNFLSLVLMLARNPVPADSIRQGRVYSVQIEIDRDKMTDCYYAYLGKLKATLNAIRAMQKRTAALQQEPLTNEVVEDVFISDVDVPVQIPKEHDRDKLMADHTGIGLATDCPREEYDFWSNQYRSIEKRFIRYLREPRRAVKTAVNEDFRSQTFIEDERAAALNEFQREEVEIRLNDEEEAMVRTKTARLFQTKAYLEQIENADKQLKRGIRQRMTKKKTVCAGGIALLAYLLGFLPLIFTNLNTAKSVLFSLLITGAVMAVFALIGLIFLFVMRYRLIKRFRHFNDVMYGTLSEIDDGLRGFSDYLSHACNVMREFSVLNTIEQEKYRKINILKKHEYFVMQQLTKAQAVFAGSIRLHGNALAGSVPFAYDFSKDETYPYGISTVTRPAKMEYLNPGHYVEAPVDYIDAITLKREELYD